MEENKEEKKIEEQIIINAENAVLGRLASYAAKQALQGKKIIILNAEKAIIVGKPNEILERYKEKRARGGSGLKGPNFPSQPEKILKRTVRGMLKYKEERGRHALKKVLCFKGIPEEYEGKKIIKAGKGKEGMSLERLARLLRGF